MQSTPISKFAAAILLICSILSCKKTSLTELNQEGSNLNNTLSESSNEGTPRANFPTLFYSCESDGQSNGFLQTIDVNTEDVNYDFQSFSAIRPNFHLFNKSAGELWGVIFKDGKDKLIKYNVNTKQSSIVDIFSIRNYVREIVSIDEINKKLYFLEGTQGKLGFARLMRCNFDGSSLSTSFTSTFDDIVAAKIGNNKLYYASKAFNALVEVPLGTQNIKVIIKGLSLVSANRFIAPIADKEYDPFAWPVNFTAFNTYKPIDERRLNAFDIDFKTNQVFWIRNGKQLLLNTVFHPYASVTLKFLPEFAKANLDGTGFTILKNMDLLIEKFGDKDEEGNGLSDDMDTNIADPKILLESNIQIDTDTRNIYIGMELIVETGINSGPIYDAPVSPKTVRFRKLKICQSNYNFDVFNGYMSFNGKKMVNPFNWNASKEVHPGLSYSEQFFTKDQSSTVFKGSLDSFIFGNKN